MKRNKIWEGWNAVPTEKKKFEKTKVPWTAKYEIKHIDEDTVVSKIIKFIIRISLFFSFDRKNLSKSKINSTVDSTYSALSSSKFKFIPSSVAFYLFLSMVPIYIIMTAIVSAFNVDWYKFLTETILPNVIPGIQTMFTVSIDLTHVGNILFIGFFILSSIWFASKGINKFRDSFTELYDFQDNTNFIIKRFKSIIFVILISLYFALIAITITPFLKWIHENTNEVLYNFFFYLISIISLLFFGYIGIGLLFKFISPIRLKWSHLSLGILTSLIPIVIFLLLFSTICKFLNYEKFGVIGSFLYLMLFILYISYFLHAGIIINSSYYKTNVFQNITSRKWLITKRISFATKNIWLKVKFNKFNKNK